MENDLTGPVPIHGHDVVEIDDDTRQGLEEVGHASTLPASGRTLNGAADCRRARTYDRRDVKLRSDLERMIYASAFARRLEEERDPRARANAIASARTSAEREAAEEEFEGRCAEQAVEYAEWIVEAHRLGRRRTAKS